MGKQNPNCESHQSSKITKLLNWSATSTQLVGALVSSVRSITVPAGTEMSKISTSCPCDFFLYPSLVNYPLLHPQATQHVVRTPLSIPSPNFVIKCFQAMMSRQMESPKIWKNQHLTLAVGPHRNRTSCCSSMMFHMFHGSKLWYKFPSVHSKMAIRCSSTHRLQRCSSWAFPLKNGWSHEKLHRFQYQV